MENAIINILIFNDNETEIGQLSSFLNQPGNNIFIAKNKNEADHLLKRKHIGILLFSANMESINQPDFFKSVINLPKQNECFIILTGEDNEHIYGQISGKKRGPVDFIITPFNKNIIEAKISVFKRLYFKNQTIVNLLENILPEGVLKEFKLHNKYTPKKHKECVILFTDFVGFSKKALDNSPVKLIQLLDYFFSTFDRIMTKYGLEKIKTIGDSYMAVTGLHIEDKNIELKTILAAIEIREFVKQDGLERIKKGLDSWEIRIGIHSGNIIGGVIGKQKFSFDIWGDSVNIAARCEHNSIPNEINVSNTFYHKIKDHVNSIDRGEIEIKNRGKIGMYFITNIKPEFSSDLKGIIPSLEFRKSIGLPARDFEGIRTFILNKLELELNPNLAYHSVKHTLKVENAVVKYANLEGLNQDEFILTQTAALFHDAGFLIRYDNNESLGFDIFKEVAPKFGYSPEDIINIENLILSTSTANEPETICEQIMCDADLDYLGRKDYHVTVNNLYIEMSNYGIFLEENEWIKYQIEYLENTHKYYTTSAVNIRKKGKLKRIKELKQKLSK